LKGLLVKDFKDITDSRRRPLFRVKFMVLEAVASVGNRELLIKKIRI